MNKFEELRKMQEKNDPLRSIPDEICSIREMPTNSAFILLAQKAVRRPDRIHWSSAPSLLKTDLGELPANLMGSKLVNDVQIYLASVQYPFLRESIYTAHRYRVLYSERVVFGSPCTHFEL